jgi:hypothetical protein
MAKTTLVEFDVEGGTRLIQALDASDFPVRVALWLYFTEAEEWRLVLASRVADEYGPLEAYSRIQRTLQHLADVDIPLQRVVAVGVNDPLVRDIRALIGSRPGLNGIRLTNNVVNGRTIADAYIYRVE